MRRSISVSALLLTSVSAILGSGWLFTSYYTATFAGPAAIIAWLLGGLAMIVIAFVFAELCTLLPLTGSSTRIPQYTHGTLVNFLFSWMIWLSYAALVPTEVQAVIQYLSYFFPNLVYADTSLSAHGYAVALILMLGMSIINIFSLRWLLRCNNFLTIVKIFIPIVIGLIVIFKFFSFHPLTQLSQSTFSPYGWQGIVTAMATGGIVFAFNGFKQACEMAGEAQHPNRALPIAIIGSIAVCLSIYLILQIAFYVSMTPHNLAGGWKALVLPGHSSPMAAMLQQDHLTGFLPLLYLGAVAAPVAAALIYVSSASRSMYGMSKNNHMPGIFRKLNIEGNPLYAIMLNFLLGMLMFAPLPGWNKMVTFLTSLMSVTYAIGPVCLLALREQIPRQHRPFKLPFARIWSTTAFYICTLLTYWSGWEIISKLSFAMAIGLGVLCVNRLFSKSLGSLPCSLHATLDLRASTWVWPYFIGTSLISYLGTFGGGCGILTFGWDFLVIGLFCVGIMWLALRFKLAPHVTQAYIEELEMH